MLVVIGVVLAGCGGASGPGVASLGKSSTTTTAPSSEGSTPVVSYTAALKYSHCMRSHGELAFPEPSPDGSFSNIPDQFTRPFIAAQKACEHLLPNGGQPTAAQIEKAMTSGLKYAQCMRSHGFPSFPEPIPIKVEGQLGIGFGFVFARNDGIDTKSRQFQKAERFCETK
jgi:hypothetical protein